MSKPAVQIRNLVKEFVDARTKQQVRAVDDVSLDIADGEFFALLGPSGCGKTTLLRMIAGFEEPTSGQVLFGERDVTNHPPNKRDAAMVFQSYAIFPHLNVFDNVAFGLKLRRLPAREIAERVARVMEVTGLSGYEKRSPSQLSGGQQQRVALARCIVMEPQLLLFDEPLSNLDAKLREQMRVEIRELQQRLGITTVYVTHDQVEAMSISDVVVVMEKGHIMQVGSPEDIYARPANRFVADFIGSNNFLPATIAGAGAVTVLGQQLSMRVPEGATGEVTLSVRPEDVRLHTEAPAGPVFEGRVSFVRDLGRTVETFVTVAGNELSVLGAPALAEGTAVWLEVPEDAGVVLAQ